MSVSRFQLHRDEPLCRSGMKAWKVPSSTSKTLESCPECHRCSSNSFDSNHTKSGGELIKLLELSAGLNPDYFTLSTLASNGSRQIWHREPRPERSRGGTKK
jgi:hypothetical protein